MDKQEEMEKVYAEYLLNKERKTSEVILYEYIKKNVELKVSEGDGGTYLSLAVRNPHTGEMEYDSSKWITLKRKYW